jgi:hypothetical protein
MRRVVVLTLLALALPIVASAGTLDIVNEFGSASVTNAGIVVGATHYSHLMQFGSNTSGNLGKVTFSTGALTSGSIAAGATFAAGGSFVVSGVGSWAKTLTGASSCGSGCTLFTGSFVGPVTWTLVSSSGGPKGGSVYMLSGMVTGTLWDGRVVSGMTQQTFFATNAQFTLGVGHIKSGDTQFPVPEPGTLGLLGTGLVGIAGMFRRKLIGT